MSKSIGEDAMGENSIGSDYGLTAWILFIVCFASGLMMLLQGLTSVSRDYGGDYLWWAARSSSLSVWPIWIYHILTPICFYLLSIHLLRHRGNANTLSVITSIFSLSAGSLWLIFFLTYRSAVDLVGVVLAIFYWSGAIILFGVTFTFIGFIYLKREPTTLTRLTGLSFIITGIFGVAVGYVGRFTLLPWFSVYEFPWVTTVALVPCILSLIHIRQID